MSGDVHVRFCESAGVRFPRATHLVMGFRYEGEAKRFLRDLRERFARFGLDLHTDKTRLIEFGRFAAKERNRRGKPKPETFDFLGFTHACGTNSRGHFEIKRRPIAKRVRAKLQEIKLKLKYAMHNPVIEQGKWLRSVVRGWFRYYAVPGTSTILDCFRTQVARMWLRTLRHRSHKGRQKWTWGRMTRLIRKWLPRARILHPYPNTRLIVRPKAGAV